MRITGQIAGKKKTLYGRQRGTKGEVLLGWGLTVTCASPAIAETNSV